jgi:Leucine-rich repeat (LRR) protein
LAKQLTQGTRPDGAAGEPWTYEAFAKAVRSSRVREDPNVSPRTVSNWCKGSALPGEIEPILRALFGHNRSERNAEARERLRKAFQAARAEKTAAVITRAKPDPAGQMWVVEGDQLVIDRTGRLTDRRAAKDPLRQQLQVAVREFAASLADRAKRLSNSPLWGDLPATATAFHALVDVDPLWMPEQLGAAYARLLRLGRFLETDSRVRDDPVQEHDPLDPDIHGLLTDLVRTAAPWLRGFPTVAAWDDEAGKALVRAELFQPARDFTRIARRLQTIPEKDAAEMELLAEAADVDDFQGRKAGNRAVGGARNLMLATAMLVAAASLEPVGPDPRIRSVATRRAGMTLAEAEAEVEALGATLPGDLHTALRQLVAEGRRLMEAVLPITGHSVGAPVPEDVELQARAMILEGHAPPSAWQPFIRSLDLSLTALKLLVPLAELTALRHLDLRRTAVTDLAPLSGLAALQHLDLRDTEVKDLAPLSRLIALQHLDLRRTAVNDLSSLPGLTDLKHLDLLGTTVSDVAPLAGLNALQHLNLINTGVSDVAPLAGLTALQRLYLRHTQVKDVAPVSGLIGLRHLDLWGTGVSDLSPLSGLTALQHLDLWGTGVSDLSPLSGLTALQHLDLRHTGVSDLSSLFGLTALQHLDLLGTKVREVPVVLVQRLKDGLLR